MPINVDSPPPHPLPPLPLAHPASGGVSRRLAAARGSNPMEAARAGLPMQRPPLHGLRPAAGRWAPAPDSRRPKRGLVSLRTAGPRRLASPSCLSHSVQQPSGVHESLHKSIDDAILLKRASEEVMVYLNERCIYLVGMMGSGKSTVGKIMAEVLGYSFFDSDKLVEQAVGIPSVAEIFKVHNETFFRDNESKVLKDLSSMRRLVVATGGGAVIRPVNWKYMRQGLSVWLDVPLEALARRIAAVGTASRPLLDQEKGDAYTKALSKLSNLFEQRGHAYENADVRVSLEDIAANQGHYNVSKLSPTDIAVEALVNIGNALAEKEVACKAPSVEKMQS